MLRKYSNSRTLKDNIKLGTLTAFSAGMVNTVTLLIFFSFASNVTGYYAILASEIAKGNMFQVAIVLAWIMCFLVGSFTSNLIVIHGKQKNQYLSHVIPLFIEMLCLASVGIYGLHFYSETLMESEILLAILLFSMGLQNGLTAGISNFAVKTTHMTGTTTDVGVLMAMFTKKEFRKNKKATDKAKLLASISICYVIGAVVSGFLYFSIGFSVFFIVCGVLIVIMIYDIQKLYMMRYLSRIRTYKNKRRLTYKLSEKKQPTMPDISPLPDRKEKEQEVLEEAG